MDIFTARPKSESIRDTYMDIVIYILFQYIHGYPYPRQALRKLFRGKVVRHSQTYLTAHK